uniref:OTU family cysteine protease n=1 Tax=Toxoplasma gondii (strain ATCC 50861 / VEG) TaxID=432359 RepID=A0A0F7UR23_TOXGV|nr:TPA: OTU family cysteine protease [Toxoplasma gondii VEG]
MVLSSGWRALIRCCQPVLATPNVSASDKQELAPSFVGRVDEEELNLEPETKVNYRVHATLQGDICWTPSTASEEFDPESHSCADDAVIVSSFGIRVDAAELDLDRDADIVYDSAYEADNEEDAWSETGSEEDADESPRSSEVLTQADEDGQSFEGDLATTNFVASTQTGEDFSGDEWEIPEEISPAEGMTTRTPTPPGGSPGDCCGDGNEEKIFGRFAALHEKEQPVCQSLSQLPRDMQAPPLEQSVQALKLSQRSSSRPSAKLPPEMLPFIAPHPQWCRRFAYDFKTPAKSLSMVPQPELSFYDAVVVERHRVAPDGNCQFRSVSYALLGTEDAHAEIRQEVAHYLRGNFNRLSWLINPDTLEEDEGRMARLDKKYRVRIPYKTYKGYPLAEDELKLNWVIRLGDARYRIWGDECTLAVMAEMYNIRIVVEQQEGDGRRATKMGSHAVQVIIPYDVVPEACIPTIFLIYDLQRQHYDVVEKVKPR